ncbi:hypothetical protein BH10PSE9_BH10PSE9_13000 [soil metagenome]
MNRILVWASLLVGAWFLWRRYRNLFRKFWGGNPPPPPKKAVGNGPITLERDPVTGVFRPPER